MIDNENHISREDKIKKESSELKDDFCCYNCQQNKHILNNLVDVYYQADIDGTIKIISPSGVKMFGVEEAKQLIGQNVRDFYDNPKDRDEFFQDLLKKGNVRKKIILKDIAGNKRIFEANSTVIFDRTHKPIATEGILRDVTEEEIIKKELHNAKEQHKILADNIIDSIWLIDLNGNFFYCSPSAQSMLGYEIKELEKIKLKKILTPISYTHVQKRVAGLIQQYKLENNPKIFEQSRYMQLTAVKKNGEQLPVEITARIIVKDNGELHIVGSTRDISERIATEKRLFKSEEQFQQTFVNASVGMIIVDKNGSIINANQAFLKMLDYDQNDIKKTSMADFVLPASYNENVLQELLNNDNSKTFQRRVRRNDGKILWTIIDVSPIKDEENNILFFISQIQDITTIIETQIELLKFKKITDKANYGVVMTDLDGKIIYTNEAFMTMHGYNKSSDVIGTEYINYCKNEQQECFENIKQALDEEGWHKTKEIWHKKNSGKIFPVLSSGQIIRNNNDKFQFVAFTVIDITDKKKVEEKIMKAQKMDSIGSLTMGIAHDFNNMLG
ncbi:MAG TPA: PAS domain S-box protein, partial [bacterium]|nr:PAS domain S-box protein [bacterium]